MNIIENIEKEQMEKLTAGKNLPNFKPGDTLKVHTKVKEGDREISEGVLNELYNSTGFNLVIGGKDKVDNIFANQRVKAIEVTTKAPASNGAYAFPAGTYFETETPADSYKSMKEKVDRYNYLRQCTFIAVSPSTNDINDAKMREEGKGFQLVTISGDDLN